MKLRHREVKELAQGHIAGKWQSQDLTQLVSPRPPYPLYSLKGSPSDFLRMTTFYILSAMDIRKPSLLKLPVACSLLLFEIEIADHVDCIMECFILNDVISFEFNFNMRTFASYCGVEKM